MKNLLMPVRFPLFLLLSALLWAACSDRQTAVYPLDPSQQYAYFPLKTGKYIDYKVDSVVYDFAPSGGTVKIESSTWVRERVGDTIRDNLGNLVYTLERYERKQADAPWELKQINTAARTENQAIRTEDNLRFLKLIFPMDRRSAWNGNIWIDENREIEVAGERIRPYTNWAYEVDSIDIAANIGTFAFDSVLVVTEANDNNVIERRYSKLRYAKNVGLVQREQWILDSQYCNQNPPPADCATKPWTEKAEKGYILKQTVVGFN
ncbi:MAG: hypothetical protein WCR52_13605 [Bacteroidota bacterium]